MTAVVGCASDGPIPTLRGEPVQRGKNPNSVVATIDLPHLPMVLLTSEKGEVDLGIFQADTGKPYVTLRDANEDGVFDLLTYSSLSATGEVRVEIEDYGMDGQPDFILNHVEACASVFYRGSWHAVLNFGKGQAATVEIEGKSLPLEDVMNELRGQAF
jgi:hypothetical protein